MNHAYYALYRTRVTEIQYIVTKNKLVCFAPTGAANSQRSHFACGHAYIMWYRLYTKHGVEKDISVLLSQYHYLGEASRFGLQAHRQFGRGRGTFSLKRPNMSPLFKYRGFLRTNTAKMAKSHVEEDLVYQYTGILVLSVIIFPTTGASCFSIVTTYFIVA